MTAIDRDQVNRWLEQKHVTLWSTFDVVSRDRRAAASEWFARELESFGKFALDEALTDLKAYRRAGASDEDVIEGAFKGYRNTTFAASEEFLAEAAFARKVIGDALLQAQQQEHVREPNRYKHAGGI